MDHITVHAAEIMLQKNKYALAITRKVATSADKKELLVTSGFLLILIHLLCQRTGSSVRSTGAGYSGHAQGRLREALSGSNSGVADRSDRSTGNREWVIVLHELLTILQSSLVMRVI
jgi:hypothetical protein